MSSGNGKSDTESGRRGISGGSARPGQERAREIPDHSTTPAPAATERAEGTAARGNRGARGPSTRAAGSRRAGEDAGLEAARDPQREHARGARDRVEGVGAAGPVLEDERPVDPVQDAVDHDRRQEQIVEVADQRNEVGDEIDRREQVEGGGAEHHLGGLREHGIADQAGDQACQVRDHAKQRRHSRLSATSSLTSLTARRSSASFTLRPRSTMARQNGQAVATTLAPVSSSSSVRMMFTRLSDLTSIHMWPPPPPQQSPRSRARGGSTTRSPGTAAAARRGASMMPL